MRDPNLSVMQQLLPLKRLCNRRMVKKHDFISVQMAVETLLSERDKASWILLRNCEKYIATDVNKNEVARNCKQGEIKRC